MKFKRLSSYFIITEINKKLIRIGKDYGSHGRSRPLYFVEVDGVIIMHGFSRQKDAKQFVLTLEE